MEGGDPLSLGMFWAGLLVASIPILLTVGAGIYAVRELRKPREENEEGRGAPPRNESRSPGSG